VNTGQRIAILVAAVVVLAGGFVLAQGSDDDGGSEQTLTPAETAARQTTDPTGGAEAPAETTETTETATTEAPPPPRVDTVRIRGGRPSGEARTLKWESGDTIRLRFTSDQAAEVHIHGYDKTVNVPAGGSARTRFKADAEGIFEIEEHHTGALLAKLEVRP
jgi:FtsP/CotA-like multicopper oxidase with cupredoxin domain